MAMTTLIVDDTVVYRRILSEAVAQVPALELAGTAPSGAIALRKLELRPAGCVLLDVHMPDMDGVETLRRIRQRFPDIVVVMISGIADRSASATIEALQLGAIDFIRKPGGADSASNMAQLVGDLHAVVRTIELRRHSKGFTMVLPVCDPGVPAAGVHKPLRPQVCVVGVSTGGPEALSRLVPALPADLKVPVLIVQHMPAGFTRSLAESLARKSVLQVSEALDGDVVLPGRVYIAPGGRHMLVRRCEGRITIGLTDEPPENSCRPSVDVLFRSAAAVYDERGVLSVVLTGMGSDGCAGVRSLRRRGGFCISQDAATCVVYGMPRAVEEAGLSDLSVPLDRIAEQICLKVQQS